MKSIIDAWHPVHSEARRGPQFTEFARDVRNSGSDGDRPLSALTEKALALLTKDTKSVAKTAAAVEEIEARLALLINYQARPFDRTDLKLLRAERDRLLIFLAEPWAGQIQLPRRHTVDAATMRGLAVADRAATMLWRSKMKKVPARFILLIEPVIPKETWGNVDELEAFLGDQDLLLGIEEEAAGLCSRVDAWMGAQLRPFDDPDALVSSFVQQTLDQFDDDQRFDNLQTFAAAFSRFLSLAPPDRRRAEGTNPW